MAGRGRGLSHTAFDSPSGAAEERSSAMGPGRGPGPGPGLGLGLGPGLGLGVLVGAASAFHSLRYFDVAVSEPSPGVPQFVIVGYVDGNLIVRYDSETGKMVPRADWMADNLDQQYWDTQTQIGQSNQQNDRIDLNTLRDRYNQSRGAHTLQTMYGCDILEDGSTRGYRQDAYDGRDFIAFDLDTMTFTAADAAAQITKRKWEKDGTVAEQWKHYLKNTCIEWLRKYVSYGRAVLERKEPPMVRVSGKEAHGILTLYCRAYGFYPRPITVSWLKDGEVRDQETEWGSIAPNSDGTYYTWASIEALPEEKDKYRCRVEHASLPEPGLFMWETESKLVTIILAVAVAILLVIAIMAGFAFWKYKSGRKKKGYDPASGTDGGSGSSAKGLTI
ncbi:class I histocompatibility antigen, F10 alpha chain-like isoform X2 [Harpia harpyja]|uniref:class I histocompatibility antigen, F10 alpha chain-like isoform X2 n=1 Tax=Harpia harpyja TaxID=202280 RepID=UPI0022B1A025|nr:class I histocompatibility antigen, F10 alpha chain-like isoform X2 [Harpia harpyja]